jgi:ribosomal-protein-serine acetyltransferase
MGDIWAYPLGDGAVLGPLEPWHLDEFVAHLDQARSHLAPWTPWATKITDAAGASSWLQRYADNHAEDTDHLYGIWLDGKLIGGVGLANFNTAMGTSDIGVWIAPDFEGRGLITRACRHVVDWAIRSRGIRRVQWSSNPDNKRSSAVATRLGFTREGLLRSAFVVAGVRCDVEVWSMLAEDWPVPAAAG